MKLKEIIGELVYASETWPKCIICPLFCAIEISIPRKKAETIPEKELKVLFDKGWYDVTEEDQKYSYYTDIRKDTE